MKISIPAMALAAAALLCLGQIALAQEVKLARLRITLPPGFVAIDLSPIEGELSLVKVTSESLYGGLGISMGLFPDGLEDSLELCRTMLISSEMVEAGSDPEISDFGLVSAGDGAKEPRLLGFDLDGIRYQLAIYRLKGRYYQKVLGTEGAFRDPRIREMLGSLKYSFPD
jgi:hypothetical protein